MTAAATQSSSTLQAHAGHLAILGVWLAIVAVALIRGRLRNRRPAGVLPRSPWLWTAAAATVLSGAVHLTVIREHFAESALYGTFFLALTGVQFGWAAGLLARPRRGWLLAGAIASLAVVLLWLATRTVGIPLGPAAGETEPFGAPDMIASAAELVVVFCALVALRPRSAHPMREHPIAA